MGLKEYKAKRRFNDTPEPEGKVKKKKGHVLKFYVQKHHASHLHYDFRLELDGVLKSWAIPKGPSLNPEDKRLAMMVEDHPLEYGNFEGIIPPGNYGAGTVMVWDEGSYEAVLPEGEEDPIKFLQKGLHSGNLKFRLSGKKLKGEFALVRIQRGKGNEWLLIKKKDKYASQASVIEQDKSVISKRTLEEIKKQSGKGKTVWHSKPSAKIELPASAIKAEFMEGLRPMMTTLIDAPFDSNDWLYEIKWDGYRAIGEVNYNQVNLYSRNLLSFNKQFPELTEALSSLGIQVILDGEICVVDENGRPDFQLIQNYKREGKGNALYFVFDIIYYDGHDLRNVPLVERKELLSRIISIDHPLLKVSDHVVGKGKEFFEAARSQKLEGIIAKRAQSKYLDGYRGKDWLKIKILCEQEAVVAGYTQPKGGRKNFGSLVLGVYEGDELVYIGHSGGGFTDKNLHETFSKLKKLQTSESPFRTKPKTNTPVTWVKPELVCMVRFQEWTTEGLMRQPIFLGFREDKDAREVKREIEKSAKTILKDEKKQSIVKTKIKNKTISSENETKKEKAGRNRAGRRRSDEVKNRGAVSRRSKTASSLTKEVADSTFLSSSYSDESHNEAQLKISNHPLIFTNLKKVFWEEENYTKEDLLEYYHSISSYILPYLKDRPENLRRNPNGYNGSSFFQKDMPKSIPDWVETIELYSESADRTINYMTCQNEAALLYMVNLGCIEINPWLSRIGKLDYPDYIVIDLDPQDVPFEQVIEVTQAVKEVLDKGKIDGYCKTSGSRGMHIYIPMGAKYDYDQAKNFALVIASLTHELVPAITSLERMPAKRRNKIYLDYLQNRKGQTLAAPYCARPKPGATVSTPLEWREIKEGLHPSRFTIKTIFDRLKVKGDLFKGIMKKGVNVEKALELLKG